MLFRFLTFIFILVTLSGCGRNFKSAIESVQIIQELNKGLEISPELIQNTPYASTIVTINDLPPIFMVLAFAERNTYNNHYKLTWISSDNGSITTENGRILHTTGLLLANLESLISPQGALPFVGSQPTWQAIYDWSPGYRYNFSAEIRTTKLESETLSTAIWTNQTQHWAEEVWFEGLNADFTNHFWTAPSTNGGKPRIVKSIQYIGPNMDRVEMKIMKHFVEPINSPLATAPESISASAPTLNKEGK